MDLISELMDVFLLNDSDMTSVFDKKSKVIMLEADQETSGDVITIPQISSSEAFNLMSRFADEQEEELQVLLLDVLNLRKPFSHFKEKVKLLDIEEAWYDYENDYAKEQMEQWLKTI